MCLSMRLYVCVCLRLRLPACLPACACRCPPPPLPPIPALHIVFALISTPSAALSLRVTVGWIGSDCGLSVVPPPVLEPFDLLENEVRPKSIALCCFFSESRCTHFSFPPAAAAATAFLAPYLLVISSCSLDLTMQTTFGMFAPYYFSLELDGGSTGIAACVEPTSLPLATPRTVPLLDQGWRSCFRGM